MLEFREAFNILIDNVDVLSAEEVAIEEAVGRVVKEDVYSSIEMPPFNKSAMDGYAVRVSDIEKVPARLKCVGIIQAGDIFKKNISKGECAKIMTGAFFPLGADGVVMVENTRNSGNCVEILKSIKAGENVCIRGEDIKTGQRVIAKNTVISGSHIGVLAAVGKKNVKVVKKPKLAVLNTGGEIIPLGKKLGKNKIYNTNGPQLCALLKADGFIPSSLGIIKDDFDSLAGAIKKGLDNDVLLVSGGVSMGDYDFVPRAFKKLGVKMIFHKVKIKPGKPLFFGKKNNKAVFGIPGNPVSNFLMYFLFIRPALYKMMGYEKYDVSFREGIVTRCFRKKTGRKHFVPVKIHKKDSDYYLEPLSGHGSADIFTLSQSDGFMAVEENEDEVKNNSIKPFITWKNV